MNDIVFVLSIAAISVILGLFVGLLIGQFRKPKIGFDEKEEVFKSIVEIGRSPKSEAFIVQVGEKLYQDSEFLREDDRDVLFDTYNKLQIWMGITPEELEQPPELEIFTEPETVEEMEQEPAAETMDAFELEPEELTDLEAVLEKVDAFEQEPEMLAELEQVMEKVDALEPEPEMFSEEDPITETVEALELAEETWVDPEAEPETDLEEEPETPDWLPTEPYESPDETEDSPFKAGINPFDMVAKAVQTDVGKPELEPKSIVDQIDDILQEKIAGTPMAEKGVRLMELPDQGLVVMVGMEKFDQVDDVDDPEVKAAIQDAVAAWEDQASSEE